MSLEFTRNVLSIHDLLFSLESIRNHKQDKKKEKKKNKKETVTVVVCVFQKCSQPCFQSHNLRTLTFFSMKRWILISTSRIQASLCDCPINGMQKKRHCVTSEARTQKMIQLPSGSFPLGTLTVGSQPLYFEEFQATQRGHSQVIWLTVLAKSQLVAIINLPACK